VYPGFQRFDQDNLLVATRHARKAGNRRATAKAGDYRADGDARETARGWPPPDVLAG